VRQLVVISRRLPLSSRLVGTAGAECLVGTAVRALGPTG
jgi:hypothetical protein